MRLPRLLGFARPPSDIPLIDDRLQEWRGAHEAAQAAAPPDWHDDLESLFDFVDSRITERRAVVALPANPPVERRTSPPPDDSWVGFGLEDPVPVVATPSDHDTIKQLAAHVVAEVRAAIHDGELTNAIRQAAREAVDEALRDWSAREAPRQKEQSPVSPSTILSIRLHNQPRGTRAV